MARDFGKILTTLWQSQKMRRLKGQDQPRLLYCYLHTCKHGNSAGCFVLDPAYAAADLGWSDQVVREALHSLTEVSLIGWDEAEMVVRIVDFIKHDPPTNPHHAIGMWNALKAIPECEEKQHAVNELTACKHGSKPSVDGEPKESLKTGSPNPIPIPTPIPPPIPRSPSTPCQTSARKEENEFVLGRGGNGAGRKFDKNTTTIKSPIDRIARFQQAIAVQLGSQGWRIIDAAMRPSSDEHDNALQLCQQAARKLGKGWPHNWPNLEQDSAA